MKKTIHFTKVRFIMIIFSLLVLGAGLTVTIVNDGFNLGVDFQAGLNLQVEISSTASVGIADIREALVAFDGVQVQVLGADNLQRFTIRLRDEGDVADFSNVKRNEVSQALGAAFGTASVEILGESYVEPRFAADLTLNTTILVVAAMACILVYLWFRFRFAYALSSLTALVHDIVFMVLFIGTFQIEVTSATIAAMLTIIGYSLNDTIVIFDRIRENEKLLSDSAFAQVIDVSITQSLSRTIITSLTTLLAVSAIFIFTTGAIRNFALNMIVGVLVGTYSSIFVASPMLLALNRKRGKKDRQEKQTATPENVQEKTATVVDSSAVKEQIRATAAAKPESWDRAYAEEETIIHAGMST